MNADVRTFPMITRVRLAQRGPFRLGAAEVRPAERTIVGPGGAETLEPRVMQVLVALADAGGDPVDRDTLVERCWDGRVVGDDAIVRVISRLRRAAAEASGGSFAIETIAKVGYRLRTTGARAEGAPVRLRRIELATEPGHDGREWVEAAPVRAVAQDLSVGRRGLMAAGLGAAAAIAAGGAAWLAPPGDAKREAAALRARGEQALDEALPERDAQGLGWLREAVRLDPRSAPAWGTLALAYVASADYARGEEERAALIRARAAAERALTIDPAQGDALAALAAIPPVFGRWAASERDLRAVLERAPSNKAALGALAQMLMGVGRVRESGELSARLHLADPLSPNRGYRWLYALWTAGRIEEADRTAARLRALWPRHPALWNVQWLLLAHSGRAGQARAMALDVEGRPTRMSVEQAARLAELARALETRAPADVARAVEGQLAMARASPFGAVGAVMALSALGALRACFAVAEGYLLGGPLTPPPRPAPGGFAHNDQRHRKTMMLFVPAAAALRADPRFVGLCEAIGLGAYWRAKGLRLVGGRVI